MKTNDTVYADKALFARIAEGDIAAFDRFFKLYRQRAVEIAYKITRMDAVAEEIAQEFFLRIWDKREGLTAVENPGAYMYMSIYYQCVNHLRRKGQEQRILELKRMTQADYNEHTQEWIDQRQLEGNIEKGMARLPELHRKIFELRYKHQVSYKEISEMLGITVGTAQTYFSQAIKLIRQHIDADRNAE